VNDIVSLIHSKGLGGMQHPCPILRKFDSSRLDGTMRLYVSFGAEVAVAERLQPEADTASLVLGTIVSKRPKSGHEGSCNLNTFLRRPRRISKAK
jgi:hypothetical protein